VPAVPPFRGLGGAGWPAVNRGFGDSIPEAGNSSGASSSSGREELPASKNWKLPGTYFITKYYFFPY